MKQTLSYYVYELSYREKTQRIGISVWKRGGEREEMMIFVISEAVKIYTLISLIIH